MLPVLRHAVPGAHANHHLEAEAGDRKRGPRSTADSSAHGERPPHHPDMLAAPDSSPLASRRATRVLSLLAGALVLTELALVGFARWRLWQTAYEGYWQQLWRVLSALVGVAFVLVVVCLFGPFVAALRPFLQQVRAESERLVRLVAARTRLPLRDVSEVATRQGQGMVALVASFAGPLLARRLTYQAPAGETVASDATPPATASGAPRPLGMRRACWRVVTGWVALPLALFLLLAGVVGQIIQSTP